MNNPAERVKAPKTERSDAKHFDESQTKELLKALDSEELKYKVMVFLDIFSGLRLGELMGLNWPNIDMEYNSIEVVRASQYLRGMGTFEKKPNYAFGNLFYLFAILGITVFLKFMLR